MYLIFVNLLFMLEFYHNHKFINNKFYEKYFNKLKLTSNSAIGLLDRFPYFKYEKFVTNFIESNKEEKQKKFNDFLTSFSSTLKNIEHQTETNNQYFIPPINPFDDKTRIDDE